MELNTGAQIPALGFGTFTHENPQEMGKAVEDAVKVSAGANMNCMPPVKLL